MKCMRSVRTAGILLVSFGASAFLFGCGRYSSASLQKSLTSITLTPMNPSIAKGLTEQYTATGTYSDASTQNLTGQATWTSSNTAVATISAAGLASGAGTGTTMIEASLDGINGSIGLAVTPAALQRMAVTPANPSIPKGLNEQYTAMGTYSDASTQNLTTQAAWTSSNTSVATISAGGLANGVGAGSATIEASLNGVTGPTGLTVTPATLRSIAIAPANPSIAKGLTEQYTATGTYNDGSTQNLTSQAAWTSSNTSVATVSTAGLANGVGTGGTTIEASLGGINGLTGLAVTPAALQSIAISPTNPSIAKGLTEQYTATGTYSDTSTQNLTSQASWTSSNTSVATISTTALASGVGTGSATIEASLSGVQGSTVLTVTPATLQSIAVAPRNPSIPNGTTEQFTATGTFSDSSQQDFTSSVTWSSTDTSVATISNTSGSNGLATSAGTGSTTIGASENGVSGSTTLAVASFAGVFTQHNDNARTGQNLLETTLTPSNVNTSSFGKLFREPVDGYIYAQPLYVANVSIAGVGHNVVYVATEGDSVYAFDADISSAPLWHVSLIDTAHGATAGETTVNIQNDLNDVNCTDLVPQVGITSTPAIDSGTGTMYVEAKSKRADGTWAHRIHMLDITTGAEKSPGPTLISATVPGTSDGGTTVTFDALHELNRPGLLLSHGTVYLGYASHCDKLQYHGWLFAYDASTLTRTAVYITTPNGQGQGGIWSSGAGVAADLSGNLFPSTGNGNFDATDVGDSVLKLTLSGNTISLSDYFTPFDQGSDDLNDYDVASGGVLLLPDQSGNHTHELVTGTKGGAIYLIDRDQMTANNQHYCSGCTSDPEIVQEFLGAGVPIWLYAAPAYWNNTVYIWGTSDVMKAYTLSNGLLSGPSSSSTNSLGFPGPTPAVSANGNANGIVWVIDSTQFGSPGPGPGPAVLHAYNATNVANELWNSSQNSGDTAGNAVKFTVPTIANGKVYIGTQTELDVYGHK